MPRSADEHLQQAIAYHGHLAGEWELRYRRFAFQSRLSVLEDCVSGLDLSNQRWLDAGCGTGTLSRSLAQHGCTVLGVDASMEMLDTARTLAAEHSRRDLLRFDAVSSIARLPAPDRSFDGILCSSVLEYVPDVRACLAEFSRVLRPGGILLVSVPNGSSVIRRAQVGTHSMGRALGRKWLPFLEYSRHQFTPSAFRNVLSEFGFKTGKIIPFGSPIPVWLQRRHFVGSLLMFSATLRPSQ